MNGFVDDGWSLMGSDGAEDVTIAINSCPNKFFGSHYGTSMFPTFGGGVLCAKASMLLQVIPNKANLQSNNHGVYSSCSKIIIN